MITFESNWEKAKTILQQITNLTVAHLSEDAQKQVQQAAYRFMITYSKLTPIVYTSVEASGILLTIRYLCNPRQRRATEQALWENILKAFAQHPDIDFAYPTQRYYHRWLEDEPARTNSPVPFQEN